MTNYGDNIKYQRDILGISQSELSRRTGISQQMLSWWESNKGLPNIDFCVKLADFYEISLDELIGRDNYINSNSSSTTDNQLSELEYTVISLIRNLKDKSDIAEVIGFLEELNNKQDTPYLPEEDISINYKNNA